MLRISITCLTGGSKDVLLGGQRMFDWGSKDFYLQYIQRCKFIVNVANYDRLLISI